MRRWVGEAGSANAANIELARNALPMVLAVLGLRAEDVFNADETGIVFGAQPCKTLVFHRMAGVKKEKDRISIVMLRVLNGSSPASSLSRVDRDASAASAATMPFTRAPISTTSASRQPT